jgi:opacity protein-like surface antigen
MRKFLCSAALAALIGAPALAANGSGNTGEIGFGIGQTDVGSEATGVDSTQYMGVRGGYDLNDIFQVEGQFATSSGDGDISGTDVDTTTQVLMVNGLYNFHPSKKEIVPYVMAGMGRADVEVEAAGQSFDDSSMAYQVGGGTRIFFGKTKRTAVRMDLALMRSDAFDESSTDRVLTAGLTWKLGGR